MLHIYEPFILKRFAENRIFFVNSKMPFEFFLECFEVERPYFLVSHLDDGRVAITPNATYFTKFWELAGTWLPVEFEYVTIKESTYPLLITAHPVKHLEEWLLKFETCVMRLTKQTLMEFMMGPKQLIPIDEIKKQKFPIRQPVPA